MAIIDLGKIKPINRGTYDSATTYAVDDFVLHGKHSFISKTDSNLNNTPYDQDTGTLDSTNWDFLAKGSEIDHKGAWDVAVTYTLNDVVRQNESSFICINAPALAQDPFDEATATLNSTYWAYFANGNRLVHQGDWDTGTSYVLNDLVTHGKHTFKCILANSAQDPYDEGTSTLNSTYWSFFAQGTAQADWNAQSGDSAILNKPVVKFGGAIRFPRRTTNQYSYRQGMVLMNDGTHRSWGADDNYAHGRGDNNVVMQYASGNGCQGYLDQVYITHNAQAALDNRGRAYGWGYQGHSAFPFNTGSSYPMPREIKLPYTTGSDYEQYPINGQRYRIYEMSLCEHDGSGQNYFALYFVYDQDNKSKEFPLGRPEMFGSGHNNHGMLGTGNTSSYTNGVGPIAVMSGKKVKQICISNGYHGSCFVITDKSDNHRGGELWTWGYNSYGALGQGNTSHNYTPTMRNGTAGLPDAPVKYVYAGGYGSYGDTFCIMEDQGKIHNVASSPGTPRAGWAEAGDGGMFYCGHANYGQGGWGSTSQRNNWTRSNSGHWAGERAKWNMVMTGGGNYNCSIAIDAWGRPWTVGYNGYGNLGDSSSTNRNSWTNPVNNHEGHMSNPARDSQFSDKLTHATSTGTFQAGEVVTGATSGAKAWIWSVPSATETDITRLRYDSTNKVVEGRSDMPNPIYIGEQCTDQNQTTAFVAGETITGEISGATAALVEETDLTKAVTIDGSNNINIDGVAQPTMELREGHSWVFDVSDSSMTGHVLSFSNTSNGTHASGYEMDDGVSRSGTPGQAGATVTWAVPNRKTITMYYYCPNHSGIGGSINTPLKHESIGYASTHRARHVMVNGGSSSERMMGYILDVENDDGTSKWDSGGGGQMYCMGQTTQGAGGRGHLSNGSTYHGVGGTTVGNSYYPQPIGPEDCIDFRWFGYDSENTLAILTSKGQVLTCGYQGSYADGHGGNNQHYYRPALLQF